MSDIHYAMVSTIGMSNVLYNACSSTPVHDNNWNKQSIFTSDVGIV